MTTVAVLVDPPRADVVLTDLVADGLLTASEAADLYAAMLADVCEAVKSSGADLLVNYRPADQLPDGVDDPEADVRAVLEAALDAPGEVRYEVQVGSTFSARAGNTVTHLLDREGVDTAAVVTPAAAFLGRKHVDSAAMKLRRSDVVLGPSTDGDVYYAGFREPVDFTAAYDPPSIETLVERANEADLSADFLPTLPRVETVPDLRTAVPQIRARSAADSIVPRRTADRIAEFGLVAVEESGERRVRRE